MTNLDLKKTHKNLYSAKAGKVEKITVPPFNYLMIDGRGNPNNSPEFVAAIEALYPLAYTIRAICKEAGQTFTVMPMQGLWDFEGDDRPATPAEFVEADKDRFIWTLMLLQPDFVTAEMVEAARETVAQKKSAARLDAVRFEMLDEGESAQIMHIGPYANEEPSITQLHDTVAEWGYRLRGKHHEIYLSDPRRVAPERMKTIIRHPIEKA